MEVYVKYANDYNDINNQVNYLLDNLLKDVEIKDSKKA